MKNSLLLLFLQTAIGVITCNWCFSQTTICEGDSALIILSSYRGDIQWQESPDSITWTNISGAVSDTLEVTVDSTSWYRAEVIEGTCLPIYSSIRLFTAVDTPAVPGTISGLTSLLDGQTGIYSISSVPEAATYTWTVPTGAIVTSGQGTNSIIVSFGSVSGNICVAASNICGMGPTTCLAVTLFNCGVDSIQDADSNWYQTVLIGTQCWFKENMRTTKYPDGSAITKGDPTHGSGAWTVDIGLYSCPPNVTNNGEDCAAAASLGMLYQWSAAMDGSTVAGAQGVCPTDWHLPSHTDWCTLENAVEAGTDTDCNLFFTFRGTSTGSKMAAHLTDQNWSGGNLTGGSGFSSSGFDLGPAGYRHQNGTYNTRGSDAQMWTSNATTSAVARQLNFAEARIYLGTADRARAESVRCVKDCPLPATPDTINGSTNVDAGQTGVAYSISSVPGATSYAWTVPSGATITSGQGTDSIVVSFSSASGNICVSASNSCGTGSAFCLPVAVFTCGIDSVQDADGNWYSTVLLGAQCWMGENLNVGTQIPPAGNQTNNAAIEKYCNGGINASSTEGNCSVWGGLYQWDEMMQYVTTQGTQGICPTSWHVPTDIEWCALENLVDASTDPACSLQGWRGSNGGTQLKQGGSSGFESLLSGSRGTDGLFYGTGVYEDLWSSTESGANAWKRNMWVSESRTGRDNTKIKFLGYSVRCVKD